MAGRPIGVLMGFRLSRNPFMHTLGYREVADLPDTARIAQLATPDRRARILVEMTAQDDGAARFAALCEYWPAMDYEPAAEFSMAARAADARKHPAAFTVDVLAADTGDTVL